MDAALATGYRRVVAATPSLPAGVVSPAPPQMWQANGALLAMLDQLLRELDGVARSRGLAAEDDIVLA